MVWAVTESGFAAADRDAGEVLSAAQQLASLLATQPACLVVARSGWRDGESEVSLRAQLAAYGVARAALARPGRGQDTGPDPGLSLDLDFDLDATVQWLGHEMQVRGPAAWVFPGSAAWRAAAARLAVRLGWPVAGEVLEFTAPDRCADQGSLPSSAPAVGVVRPVFGGSLLAVEVLAVPCIISVRPRAFAGGPQEGGALEPSQVGIEISAGPPAGGPEYDARTRLVGVEEHQSDLPAMGDAEVIVAGGRGIGGADGFELLVRLARALGGCVGASRAAVDAGWMQYENQVGQSGRTVAPRLYVAVGISGAAQHLAGMRGSRVVVAINRNHEAPIFGACNFGLQGDWREIVTALLDQLAGGDRSVRN